VVRSTRTESPAHVKRAATIGGFGVFLFLALPWLASLEKRREEIVGPIHTLEVVGTGDAKGGKPAREVKLDGWQGTVRTKRSFGSGEPLRAVQAMAHGSLWRMEIHVPPVGKRAEKLCHWLA